MKPEIELLCEASDKQGFDLAWHDAPRKLSKIFDDLSQVVSRIDDQQVANELRDALSNGARLNDLLTKVGEVIHDEFMDANYGLDCLLKMLSREFDHNPELVGLPCLVSPLLRKLKMAEDVLSTLVRG